MHPKKSTNENILKPPSSISNCLDDLKKEWHKNHRISSLWQDWAKILGEPLASNCQPISLVRGVLTVGSSHTQWLQALIFNRNQLLAALQAEGHSIKELRIKKQYFQEIESHETQENIWSKHPSRADLHGMTVCKKCNSPSPAGEISLWGKCGLCRRQDLLNSN